jgi:hypothetical protein
MKLLHQDGRRTIVQKLYCAVFTPSRTVRSSCRLEPHHLAPANCASRAPRDLSASNGG